jgi:hypothetical protein
MKHVVGEEARTNQNRGIIGKKEQRISAPNYDPLTFT